LGKQLWFRFAGAGVAVTAAAGLLGALVSGNADARLPSATAGATGYRSAIAQIRYARNGVLLAAPGSTAAVARAASEALELAAVGARVGAKLTPENVALPGLRFTVAFMLAFDGWPLGAIAFVDPNGSPVLLCIIANGGTDSSLRLEKRDGLPLATWSRDGRGYLVIGRQPEQRIAEFARLLEQRI